jgi:arginine-tRNA-protein transferase
MISLMHYLAPERRCSYLGDQRARLEYHHVLDLSEAEYLALMLDNWRRFGRMLFRPACAECRACRAVRVRVDDFRPDRSQRRVRKLNEHAVALRIEEPSVSAEKLELYDRYHAHQAEAKGWPHDEPQEADEYFEMFVSQPFPIEEWRYYLDERLVGVGYVDALAGAPPPLVAEEGLSAIYFFYDPDERGRSLGIWNVLCLIEEARRRGLSYVYLGYYVAGCGSTEYKGRFSPSEIRDEHGIWGPFRREAGPR